MFNTFASFRRLPIISRITMCLAVSAPLTGMFLTTDLCLLFTLFSLLAFGVDVTVTAAEVLPAADTQYLDGILGGTVTAGQTVYLDASTGTYKAADANASAATATVKGIAMTGGVSAQPVKVANGGSIDPGFTVTVGTIYVQSATAGGIAPAADLATGHYTTIVGIGITASNLKLLFSNSGVAVP